MAPSDALREAFAGRTVLLTGHTGFKGAWLSLILSELGARVVGVALPPLSGSLYERARLDAVVDGRIADIAGRDAVRAAVAGVDADVVIHMAAQALVRPSYADPVGTFATNALGTAVVLDAARTMSRLRAVVVVTTDKCYDNTDQLWAYRECDPLGGADPYSASKACTELVAAAFRRSFFAADDGPALATARAGNVFGGGDVAPERLVPDIVAAHEAGTALCLRRPHSVRPWQHVLDPLLGYLALAAALLRDGQRFAEAWNFGPDAEAHVSAAALAGLFAAAWGGDLAVVAGVGDGPHEAATLRLDSSKARARLGWRPAIPLGEAVRLTAAWHDATRRGADPRAVTRDQIARIFAEDALARAA